MEIVLVIIAIVIIVLVYSKYKSKHIQPSANSKQIVLPKFEIKITGPEAPLRENDFKNREEYYNAVYKGDINLYDDIYHFIKKEVNNQFFTEQERLLLKKIIELPPELYLAYENLVEKNYDLFEIVLDLNILPHYLLGNAIQRLINYGILHKNVSKSDIPLILERKQISELNEIASKYSLKKGGKKNDIIKRIIDSVPDLDRLLDFSKYCKINIEIKAIFYKARYLQILDMEKKLLDGKEKTLRFNYLYPIVEFYYKNKFYKNWEKCIKYAKLDIELFLGDFLNEKFVDNDGSVYHLNEDARVPTVDTLFKIYIKQAKYPEAITLCEKVEKLGYKMDDEKELANKYVLEQKNSK